MSFSINKYDNVIFHKDELVDKKIKALFLFFDYNIYVEKISKSDQLLIIDQWINEFESIQLYEVIPFFIKRKIGIKKSILKEKYDKMSLKERLVYHLTKIKISINNIYKTLTKG